VRGTWKQIIFICPITKTKKSIVNFCSQLTNPGIFGDQCQPMTIRLVLKVEIGYRCHQVAYANFAVGDQNFIGFLKARKLKQIFFFQ
jgi:hypothetical protein